MVPVSNQHYALPLLICPKATFINEEDAFRLIQFGELPIHSVSKYDKSSSSSYPSHCYPLDWCNSKVGLYLCEVCRNYIDSTTAFYTCKECEQQHSTFFIYGYHKECVEPIFKHPYHPNHSLHLRNHIDFSICFCCSEFNIFLYMCSICIFSICTSCAKKPPVLKIDHPKRHQHTLFHFPKKGSLICDVCSLGDQSALMYTCLQCNFVVHKDCVYFPCIIKISRHEHRLSFKSSLTPEKWLCGVCRTKIDTNYGRYCCIKGCNYGVHSKCATREDVWDGKELEGQPEDTYEDVKSFNQISDGIIQHFSHKNHHMRLDEETNRAFDDNKRCQACTFPIYEDNIYSCVQCDFILHQECAYLPRKKQHATHPHPISLRVKHYFQCDACQYESNGFAYLCDKTDCSFMLDLRCASVAEPLDHQCHPHPLFLTSKPYSTQRCSICCKSSLMCLNCGECDFVLCFRCATLPNKMRYRLDDHFLIFLYDKDANGQYVCDGCEKEVDPKKGMYMCNDCDVTLHIQCLLGKDEDMYKMPSREIKGQSYRATILPNNRLTRNICWQCNNRCQGKIVYEGYKMVRKDGSFFSSYQEPKEIRLRLFCSYNCLGELLTS